MLPIEWLVQTLEARFHPRTKLTGPSVIIGTVNCDGERVMISACRVPPRLVRPFDPAGLLTKLRFLVASALPDPFTELVHLRSDYWSFTKVDRESPSPADPALNAG